MPIKIPVINKGLTLQEIPGEISVFFEIGNCIMGCKGCHSEYLKIPVASVHFTALSEMAAYAEKEKTNGATAILLMGGTTNRIDYEELGNVIITLGKILPVGIYSGAAVNSHSTKFLKILPGLKWIKAGEYNKKLGGLKEKTTNQRFYMLDEGKWLDKTNIFQKEKGNATC